jgi:inhibitor of KinA
LNHYKLTYKHFSEHSILVEWPQKIDKNILNDVLLFKIHIENSNIKEIVQINSAYNSILIIYNTAIDIIYDEISILKKFYSTKNIINKSSFRLWEIPVCYDEKFAIDLEEISSNNNIEKEQIIRLHFNAIYTVYFIGFLPGFLYLGGLEKQLHFPRKSTPRSLVEKGAVGIGGNQTGIYPNQSLGGWNIIGNSPILFFDVSKQEPCFAKTGDKIQFYPISLKEHSDISALVEAGVYQIESEVFYG